MSSRPRRKRRREARAYGGVRVEEATRAGLPVGLSPPGHGERYRRVAASLGWEPGAVLKESWGYGTVVSSRLTAHGVPGERRRYTVTLRRMTAEEEAVREVMES